MTLVDSLDMLAVVGDYPEFRRAVTRVIHTISFDRNVTVSVFETTIRVLGGLLSAHVLASDPAYGMVPWYKGGWVWGGGGEGVLRHLGFGVVVARGGPRRGIGWGLGQKTVPDTRGC